MTYQITNQRDLRKAFWAQAGVLADFYKVSYRQNDYSATVRCEWCDYVDVMQRDGRISEALADSGHAMTHRRFRHELRQMVLAGAEMAADRVLAQRRADARLVPKVDQHSPGGLWDYEGEQLDLVEMFQDLPDDDAF